MLKDKVAIITGGTRGIGLETAKVFKKNGAEVIIFGSKKESVTNAIEILRKENIIVEGFYPDLNSSEEIQNTLKKINDKYHHIDILVNNAGISASKKTCDTSLEEFKNIFDVNVMSMYNVSKEVIKYMTNGGAILNTSSMVSIYGQPSGVGYPSSKFAVNGLTKSLARELAPLNIRVNAVAPGIINTDMVSNLPKEVIDPLIKTIPLGRIGQPVDIANAFLFLASDMASYITGAVLSVDGAARS